MKKQTATEWLFEKIMDSNSDDDLYEFLKQAKAMEKEQLEEAWMDGMEGILHEIAAEQYYNETYVHDPTRTHPSNP